MQHTATWYKTLQHNAALYNIMQHSTTQHTATHCNMIPAAAALSWSSSRSEIRAVPSLSILASTHSEWKYTPAHVCGELQVCLVYTLHAKWVASVSRLHFTRQMSCKCVSSTLYTPNELQVCLVYTLHAKWVASVSRLHFTRRMQVFTCTRVGWDAVCLVYTLDILPSSSVSQLIRHYCNIYQHTLHPSSVYTSHPTVIVGFATAVNTTATNINTRYISTRVDPSDTLPSSPVSRSWHFCNIHQEWFNTPNIPLLVDTFDTLPSSSVSRGWFDTCATYISSDSTRPIFPHLWILLTPYRHRRFRVADSALLQHTLRVIQHTLYSNMRSYLGESTVIIGFARLIRHCHCH